MQFIADAGVQIFAAQQRSLMQPVISVNRCLLALQRSLGVELTRGQRQCSAAQRFATGRLRDVIGLSSQRRVAL